MIRRIAIITALALCGSPSAFAAGGHQGSLEDQMACTPDVYRLCSSMVPDEDRIVACLERNKPNLSPACAKVFSSPAPGQSGQSDDEE